MKYIILFFISGVSMNCSSAVDCKVPSTNQECMSCQDKLNYDSIVLVIKEKVVDLTNSSDLFLVPDFVSLYENPIVYQNDAISFLADEKYSYEEKAISIYTMQKAELKTYIEFFKEVMTLFHKNKINESMLSLALSAPINKRYILIKNYKNKDVSSMLIDLKNSEKTSPELKKRIDDILSGESWKNVREFL